MYMVLVINITPHRVFSRSNTNLPRKMKLVVFPARFCRNSISVKNFSVGWVAWLPWLEILMCGKKIPPPLPNDNNDKNQKQQQQNTTVTFFAVYGRVMLVLKCNENGITIYSPSEAESISKVCYCSIFLFVDITRSHCYMTFLSR